MDVSAIKQPEIEWLGIRIQEPVTCITDVLIGLVCFYAWYRLRKANGKQAKFKLLEYYFISMGVATMAGGLIGHGFLYLFNDYWKLLGWYTSMLSVGLIERSSIKHAIHLIKPKTGKFFLILNWIELAAMMALTAYTLHFKFVEFHSLYGFLVVVFGFHFYVWRKTGDRGSKMILWSIAVLAGAVYIFNAPVILHEFFNHRDFAHILMAIGSYMILLAALRMEDQPQPTE